MTCPICTKDTDPKFRPFCSKRCANIDLSKWLSGSYAIPTNEPDLGDEDEIVLSERLN
ncbi:DNA gyrase inhibitor YacG [Parasulfitobacter algicola]|uniref:DNA gyrase inhibitor YacG n=1 Tax=Parasulfitobacter algicola TaxID=2614809 RepID=A0ABX2IPI2_9RHOB|nr:DNA gyrase inhibitor YacG [Sulfitobacter algicola]NSX54797.1 DNA gyrase inhibitor YacG [Sulfitobacter algicola]